MALEDVQAITDGANVIASLMNQGMSREAAEKRLTGELRAAQREQYRQRQAREGNRAAAEAFLAQDDAEYDFIGQPVDEEDLIRTLEVEAGENPQELFDESGLADKSKKQRYEITRESAKRARKEGKTRRAQFLEGKAQEAAESQKAFDFGLAGLGDNAVVDEDGIAYSSVQGPSFDERRAAKENDRQEGRRAVRESLRRSEGRLRNDEIEAEAQRRARRLLPDDAEFIGGEKYESDLDAIRTELYQRQARGMEGGIAAARLESLDNARREAEDIAATAIGQRALQGERNIGRIAEIRSISPVKSKEPTQVQVVLPDDPIAYEQAIRMVGPGGDTVGYSDARSEAFLGDINAGTSDNMVNAPQLPRAHNWVAQNVGNSRGRAGATSFGTDTDVDITGTLREFTRRINGLGYGDGIVSDIRSAEEFDRAISYVTEKAEQKGDTLFSFDTEQGKNTAATAPGIDEVLTKARYTPNERNALANALYQLTSAQLSGVNQDSKDAYAARVAGPTANVEFDSAAMRGNDRVKLERVKNEKVGVGKNRQDVKAELAKLSDPDAQRPFIGAVEGEPPQRAKFLRGRAVNMTPDERIAAFGPENAAIANELESREKKSRADREARLSQTSDPTAVRQRALDARFAEEAYGAEYKAEMSERAQLQELIKSGKLQLPSESQLNQDELPRRPNRRIVNTDSGQTIEIPTGIPAGAKLPSTYVPGRTEMGREIEPPKEAYFGRGAREPQNVFRRQQPIQEAPVPASITPQPGAGTGNQSAPAVDAGRGGWMGGGNGGRIVNPFQPEEPSEPSRRPPQSMIDELNAVSRRKPSNMYMTSPDGPGRERERREVVRGLKRQNLRRRVGIGAAGAGATAGLAALINGEREEREQEAYQ